MKMRKTGYVVVMVVLGVLALVVGALALRSLLVTETPGEGPGLRLPPITREGPTETPAPSTDIRILPGPTPRPGETPQPAAITPGTIPTATPERFHITLPGIFNGQGTEPLETQLTPEPSETATPTPGPTSTPGPTATATPTRGPLRVTKLGIGLYDSGGAHLPQLDRMRPSVILLMDPTVDFAQSVRKAYPRSFIVGRIYELNQSLDNPEQGGANFADRVAQTAVPLRGVVDAWMSYNEVVGHDDYAAYGKYNTFQVAFANRLQDHYGIPAVASNDASATVEPYDYPKYFAESISASRYFGLHAYAPPSTNSMRSPEGQELMLRYRQIKAELDKAGVKTGEFVITECGLWDGWVGVASEQSMADDFIWFANQLDNDDYVVGTMIFGLFTNDRWQQFNVGRSIYIMDRVGSYNTQS